MYFLLIMTICLEILFSTMNIQCPLSNRILVQDVLISASFSILCSNFCLKRIPIVKHTKLEVEPLKTKLLSLHLQHKPENFQVWNKSDFPPASMKAQFKVLAGMKKPSHLMLHVPFNQGNLKEKQIRIKPNTEPTGPDRFLIPLLRILPLPLAHLLLFQNSWTRDAQNCKASP